MAERLKRAEVPAELTWRIEDLFATSAHWETALASLDADVASFGRFKGRLHEGASLFLQCMEEAEALGRKASPVVLYAHLLIATDGTDPANQAIAGRAHAAVARIRAGMAFLEPEIVALPAGTVEGYIAAEPGLEPFRRYLMRILSNKPHVLSPETERVLASLGELMTAPYNLYERCKSSDMHFEPATDAAGREHPVSFATYEVLLEKSSDTVLRRNAYRSFSKGLASYREVLGGTFGAEVRKNVVLARARGFESATHMFLHQQESSMKAYLNLLDVVQREMAPHMRRYVGLRKRVLGLDEVLYCDIEAPLDPDCDPGITYEEAGHEILASVQVMGKEFSDIVATALADRWIDRADNIGKSTGAFCADAYDAHPFILTTWSDKARSMFTLAHELGHAVADVFTARTQRYANKEMSRFIVEGPSTFMEALLARHLLSQPSVEPRKRRWVAMQVLGTYYHNYVRHMLEAELLRRIYDLAEAGTPITATVLSKTKGEILSEFWGGTVVIDEGALLTWMRQPHYYMGLYPYTYSAGLTFSTLMAQALAAEGDSARDRWLEVLRTGGSMKPLDVMKRAGVDLEDAASITRAIDYVGTLVDEVETAFCDSSRR
ncbi:MAG: Oligoendopeptidase F, plasmid [Firmicutes bacterium ADurb.Bin506]|nr:MAG: Oligoendopeptidase F, plasmid [Firmicutes bacterium ADurb.Bin506]